MARERYPYHTAKGGSSGAELQGRIAHRMVSQMNGVCATVAGPRSFAQSAVRSIGGRDDFRGPCESNPHDEYRSDPPRSLTNGDR